MRDFNVPGRSAAMAANGMAATSHPRATLTGARRAARRRQRRRCRDRSGRDAVRRRAAEHRHRGRLLCPLFAPRCIAGRAQRLRTSARRKPLSTGMSSAGSSEIAVQTPHAVTVPGAVDAWCTFNREHGTRPLSELLEPAARAAEEGYVVTPRIAADWHRSQEKLRDPITAALFLPGGKPPAAGDKMTNPPLAATLRRIGREGREAFYARTGDARHRQPAQIAGWARTQEADFADQRSNWVEPINASYRRLRGL